MFKFSAIIVFLSISLFSGCAQNDTNDYLGNWEGILTNKEAFNFSLLLEGLESNTYNITIANTTTLINEKVKSTSNDHIQFSVDDYIHFNLRSKDNDQGLTGFVNAGRLMYHISLEKTGENTYVGNWNPFMIDDPLRSDSILLGIDTSNDGTLVIYPFFGDPRFSGIWADNFIRQENIVSFRCLKTGLTFRAKLLENKIELEILLADAIVSKMALNKLDTEWEPQIDGKPKNQNTHTPLQLNDGWITANSSDFDIDQDKLVGLIGAVHDEKFENTHSVLIAKEDKLVFEVYFDGFNPNISHDMRSASKSISSAMIGIAIDDKVIGNVDQKLYDFIPEVYQRSKDVQKSKITIKDLLTMSSGLDVNDKAEEGYYQESDNWLRTVLEAPMVNEPGTYTDYGSANPFLLGVILDNSLERPVEVYMDEKLFAPLGIVNYINQTEDTETTPYFGGGMHLTSRDMLKFGQLYLNKGLWKSQRIISKEWVNESTKKHTRLEDVSDKNEYGYQWWHDAHIINGKTIRSIEARGAGGQYIFVIPDLNSVVVITSGNFRNGKTRQPEKILEEYILPAIIK